MTVAGVLGSDGWWIAGSTSNATAYCYHYCHSATPKGVWQWRQSVVEYDKWSMAEEWQCWQR